MKITASKEAGVKFKQNLAGLGERIHNAMIGAANMAASMIEKAAKADIQAAGKFGGQWVSGLHVDVSQGAGNNMLISMYHDDPRAAIFETGGVISGHPLLWIPFTGTDAEGVRASEYGDLFSSRSKDGLPLLFGRRDKQPKYFGVSQVTIPKKFHLKEIQDSVMANFRDYFDAAFRGS